MSTRESTANIDPSKNSTRRLSLQRKKKPNSASKAKNVSYMLAANNMVFICLTLPIVVFQSLGYDGAWFRNPDICDLNKAKIRLVKVLCIVLMNANCSINIFIYSFMSSEFRRTLVALSSRFMCCFRGQNLRSTNGRPIDGVTKRQFSRLSLGNQTPVKNSSASN